MCAYNVKEGQESPPNKQLYFMTFSIKSLKLRSKYT